MQHSLSLEADHDIAEHRTRMRSTGSDELFDDHFEAVFRYFSRRVSSMEDAQDLTAETFAASVGSRIPRNVEPLSWLYGIGRRRLADFIRRKKRNGSIEAIGTDVRAVERARDLWALIDALPAHQREALLLQALEDLSIPQIAHVMKRSPGSVKALLQRAKDRVRQESRIELKKEERP